MVSAAVPDDVSVIAWVAVEFSFTLPKLTDEGFIFRPGVEAPRFRLCCLCELFVEAVSVTDCAFATGKYDRVNVPLVVPCGMVISVGTVTALLLLFSATLNPPESAGELRIRVQFSDPCPTSVSLSQVKSLSTL